MGYVTYNHSLQRTGFRPYGKTNTFAATQLSGVPSEGLGQNYPFTAGGGWRLHGLGEDLGELGDVVPDGSIVEYHGQWRTTATTLESPADLLRAVVAAVNQDGLHVFSSSSDAGFFSSELLGNTFNVTLRIQVSNGMGYGNPNDIASIVDHEVYVAEGELPQGSSVSVVALPGAAGGSPGTPTDWTSWLEQNATWIGLALAGIVVIPMVMRRIL